MRKFIDWLFSDKVSEAIVVFAFGSLIVITLGIMVYMMVELILRSV